MLLFGFRLSTNPVYITGHIKKNPKDTLDYVAHLNVFVKEGNKVLAKTQTDAEGNFELAFTPKKEKSSDFYCFGVSIDTLLIASVTTFDSDTPEMTFFIPNIYLTNKLGKIICPKCKKSDRVHQLFYSKEICIVGDTTHYTVIKGKTKPGHNYLEVAKFHCDRDKVNF